MPVLCEFNTQSVRAWDDPKSDTRLTVNFPYPLVARPRILHGFRMLDVSATAHIRAMSAIPYCTHTWADCHISTWADSTLHSGIASLLVLAPADLDFLTGERARAPGEPASVRVHFERRFVTPPKVVVFLNHVDLDKDHNWRLNVDASDIDVSGFTLHIDTWGDTILYGAKAGWIAYPEDRAHIFSASFNTMDVRPVTRPQHCQNKEISFGAQVKFWENPTVFVGLNFLDVDCKANLRVKAYVDGVSETGLVCHIDSWCDTVLYAAGVSIIAFN